jgi:hypothetical protein
MHLSLSLSLSLTHTHTHTYPHLRNSGRYNRNRRRINSIIFPRKFLEKKVFPNDVSFKALPRWHTFPFAEMQIPAVY